MRDSALRASISALVPVAPPPEALEDVHRAISGELEGEGRDWEVIFLVEHSSPTIERLHAIQERDATHVRVLEFDYAVGEAAMLRAGAEIANGDLLLTIPCPLEVEPASITALCAAVDGETDMAVATRRAAVSGRFAVAQSRIFNRLISMAAGMRVRDVASSTRLMRREVLQEIPLYGEFHRYLPILAERTGFHVDEVEAEPHVRSHRTSIHAPLTYFWRLIDIITVLFISRFTRRPLRLFGSLGALFLALGVPILAVVGVERLLGTPLANRPILVLGTLLVGLGVQAFTIGLLGELLLFFNAGSFRDYRIAEIWESTKPIATDGSDGEGALKDGAVRESGATPP